MNRQVPKTYTIIGDGKVARHFGHYFNLLGISFKQWQRTQSIQQLKQAVANSDVVLLLISDDAIEPFIHQHSFLQNQTLVHFSGVLNIKGVFGCHPLMTFAQELYGLEIYQSIPFVCDEGIVFENLFPKLQNNSFNIPLVEKAYYHAMCVMAGNFSQMLMKHTAKQLHFELDLPADILFPYLMQNTQNFISNPESSATGPLQRGDITTIQKHLQALEGYELEDTYKSFLKFSNINTPSFQIKTPSFLRRQESHYDYRDLRKNKEELGDSCLRRNDEVLLRNDEVLLRNDEVLLRNEEVLLRNDEGLLRNDKSFVKEKAQ